MTVNGRLVAAMSTVCALAGVCVAAPATAWAGGPAGGELNGTYRHVSLRSQGVESKPDGQRYENPVPGGDRQETWTIVPCGDGCADIVFDYGSARQMYLIDGRWHMTGEIDDAIACNGVPTSGVLEYSFDPQTLAGHERRIADCPGEGQIYLDYPATLTRIGG